MTKPRAKLAGALKAVTGAQAARAIPPAAAKREPAPRAPSRVGTKAVCVNLDPAAVKQLKLIGIEADRTLHDQLREAINDYFKKNGKPSIA